MANDSTSQRQKQRQKCNSSRSQSMENHCEIDACTVQELWLALVGSEQRTAKVQFMDRLCSFPPQKGGKRSKATLQCAPRNSLANGGSSSLQGGGQSSGISVHAARWSRVAVFSKSCSPPKCLWVAGNRAGEFSANSEKSGFCSSQPAGSSPSEGRRAAHNQRKPCGQFTEISVMSTSRRTLQNMKASLRICRNLCGS